MLTRFSENSTISHMGRIIALSGFAGVGKDEFYKISKEILRDRVVKRLSFADSLKKYLDDFMRKETGFSAFTNDPEEKKIVRPYLVSIANYHRYKSNGRFWIDRWNEDKKLLINNYDFLFVCDLRFVNEVVYLKNEQRSLNISIDLIQSDGKQKGPANVSEASQTVLAKNLCDLKFVWNQSDEKEYKIQKVKEFFDAHSSKLL